MQYELPEIYLEYQISSEGRKCIDAMLEISKKAGFTAG
jgi:hypothetical protein